MDQISAFKSDNFHSNIALTILLTEDTTTDKFQKNDIKTVIEKLGPNEIRKFFGSLGLTKTFIDQHKNADRSDVLAQAKNVLMGWIKETTPTMDDLLKALERAGNKNASEELQDHWKMTTNKGIVTIKNDSLHLFFCVVFLLNYFIK